MILSAQTLRRVQPVSPFVERQKSNGLTYGLGPAGYDIRIAEDIVLHPGCFVLASAMERFTMPEHVLGIVHDKSTWARMGLSVFNTVIEPGWRGYLTLELANQNAPAAFTEPLTIDRGTPIAQVIFHFLDLPTDTLYQGKYSNQKAGPQPAKFE